MDVDDWIAGAEVIDVSHCKGRDRVLFGATVELMDVEHAKKVRYRIVGETEADLKQRPDLGHLAGRPRPHREARWADVTMVTSPGGPRVEIEARCSSRSRMSLTATHWRGCSGRCATRAPATSPT